MQLYLIRHTQVALPPGICYGQTDVALADSWSEDLLALQTKLPPEALAADAFFTSPLQRCLQLAEVLAAQHQRSIIQDQRLQELNFGCWEGLAWDDIAPDEMQRWSNDYVNTPVPNGESFQSLADRGSRCLDAILAQNLAHVSIVTHSGMILALLARLLDLDLNHAFRLRVDYGSISAAHVSGDWIKVDYINR